MAKGGINLISFMILFLFFPRRKNYRFPSREPSQPRRCGQTHFLLKRLNRIKNNDLSRLVCLEPSYIFDSERIITNNILALQ